IQPADVIAWSLWRRAHQAAAQKSPSQTKITTVVLGVVSKLIDPAKWGRGNYLDAISRRAS
ncbi:MAG: hypothetical protein WBZ28_20720, partial [Pseudolabrys sp.]